MLSRLFHMSEHGSSISREIVAGSTTFMTMAYIIFVQPQVLSKAGMDAGAVMMATCLAAAMGCFLMAMWANLPIALAPGMGENFFFTFTVVLTFQVPWQKALGAVFISGAVFVVLSLFKVRKFIFTAIPHSLKNAIAVGIGLFIAFIGMKDAGLVVPNPGTFVKFGNIKEPAVLLALSGLFITSVLLVRKVKGAILIGMVITACAGFIAGLLPFHGIVALPPSLAPTLGRLDILGALRMDITIIIVFLFMDMFDTIGTLVGVGTQAKLLKNGELPRCSQALLSDAVATTAGAVLGTSTVTSYIESASGVEAGGRTGLTSVIVGILFLCSVFFYPLVKMFGGAVTISQTVLVHPVTAPALILVGSFMVKNIIDIAWSDLSESIPAFLIIVGIPLTFSISDGLALGFITYPFIKLLSGKHRQVSWLMYLLAFLFLFRYIIW